MQAVVSRAWHRQQQQEHAQQAVWDHVQLDAAVMLNDCVFGFCSAAQGHLLRDGVLDPHEEEAEVRATAAAAMRLCLHCMLCGFQSLQASAHVFDR